MMNRLVVSKKGSVLGNLCGGQKGCSTVSKCLTELANRRYNSSISKISKVTRQSHNASSNLLLSSSTTPSPPPYPFHIVINHRLYTTDDKNGQGGRKEGSDVTGNNSDEVGSKELIDHEKGGRKGWSDVAGNNGDENSRELSELDEFDYEAVISGGHDNEPNDQTFPRSSRLQEPTALGKKPNPAEMTTVQKGQGGSKEASDENEHNYGQICENDEYLEAEEKNMFELEQALHLENIDTKKLVQTAMNFKNMVNLSPEQMFMNTLSCHEDSVHNTLPYVLGELAGDEPSDSVTSGERGLIISELDAAFDGRVSKELIPKLSKSDTDYKQDFVDTLKYVLHKRDMENCKDKNSVPEDVQTVLGEDDRKAMVLYDLLGEDWVEQLPVKGSKDRDVFLESIEMALENIHPKTLDEKVDGTARMQGKKHAKEMETRMKTEDSIHDMLNIIDRDAYHRRKYPLHSIRFDQTTATAGNYTTKNATDSEPKPLPTILQHPKYGKEQIFDRQEIEPVDLWHTQWVEKDERYDTKVLQENYKNTQITWDKADSKEYHGQPVDDWFQTLGWDGSENLGSQREMSRSSVRDIRTVDDYMTHVHSNETSFDHLPRANIAFEVAQLGNQCESIDKSENSIYSYESAVQFHWDTTLAPEVKNYHWDRKVVVTIDCTKLFRGSHSFNDVEHRTLEFLCNDKIAHYKKSRHGTTLRPVIKISVDRYPGRSMNYAYAKKLVARLIEASKNTEIQSLVSRSLEEIRQKGGNPPNSRKIIKAIERYVASYRNTKYMREYKSEQDMVDYEKNLRQTNLWRMNYQ